MKHVFYSLGITSFLVCMIFSVTTSITNPFYGMSEAAVAQATTYTSTTGISNGNTSYSINPYMYDVYEGNTTFTTQKKYSSFTESASFNLGFKGFVGATRISVKNPVGKQDVLSINLGDRVNCINGGFNECYATPGKPTKVYY